MGGRCSAWGALRMHQRNLALQKDVKRQKKDIDRLYTEYDSLCKDYNRVLEERNDLRVKHELTTSSITTPQEYKSVLDERNASSIYMWAYTGEKFISPTASKFSPGVISHMVLKGGVQGF